MNFTILNLNKFSPAIYTLLVFLLAQGLGTCLMFGIGLLISPDLPLHEHMPTSLLSLILMTVDILAVVCCYFLIHNIQFGATSDFSAIRWKPGMSAIAGGFLGALSISILTDSMELPDEVLQTSIAMSHNIWGLLTLVIVGPITEELLFREGIAGEMLRRGTNPWIEIMVSALAFSFMHLNLAQGLYALPLGIIFGIIYYKTGNIVLTSILHVLNNGIVVVQLYIMREDFTELSYSKWFGGDLKAYAAMLVLGALCIVLMGIFWKSYRPLQRKLKKVTPIN